MNKIKKLGIFIPLLGFGGSERFVSNISKFLNKNFVLFLIVFDSKNQTYDFEGKIIDLSVPPKLHNSPFSKLSRLILRIKRAKKEVNDNEIDILLSIGFVPALICLFISKKVIKIFSIRTYETILKLNNFIFKFFIYLIINNSNFLLLPSKLMEDSLNKLFKINKNKIIVIPNPVDSKFIKKYSKVNPNIYINSKFSYIVSIGTLIRRKGHLELINSFNSIHNKFPNLRMIIAGNNYDNYKTILDEKINSFRLNEKIKIYDFLDNPFPIVNKASIYVSCSFIEGFPNNLIEAMVLGKPIISYDCLSGPREILSKKLYSDSKYDEVEFNDFGIIIKSKKRKLIPDERESIKISNLFSHAIQKLLEDKDLYQKYKTLSFKRSLYYSKYLFEKRLLKLIALLK